ncbi:MAG TPA: tetratricopeptide repeat protein [Geobacteraceae bacterium]
MPADRRLPLLGTCLLLSLLTLAIFWQVGNHAFLTYDDDGYVTNNAMVRAGLTRQGIGWAFTAFHEANWHPLTWISHMADCQLFGLAPRGHHLTNLALHLTNTLLLFTLLTRLTGRHWPSAVVAALFAGHPLHVESVAWLAERKDLLAALFWLLTLSAYHNYTIRPTAGRYLTGLLLFGCGLLAKPMVVTLPFVLLLLDWWPLARWPDRPLSRLVVEKLPYFLLACGSCIITVLAQARGLALIPLDSIPMAQRLANLPIAYLRYLAKLFWPARLAVFYPIEQLPWWQSAGALALLMGITAVTLLAARRCPYLAVGWLWFLGTLVPVSGLVQVGEQAMADRYTYLPLIGPFIMLAWGIPDLLAGWRHARPVMSSAAAAAIGMLAVVAWHQTATWRDTVTLFSHAVSVTEHNYFAHGNLGVALAARGEDAAGDRHFRAALADNPRYGQAWYNLGVSLEASGKLEEAEHHFAEAARLKPTLAEAHYNLGVLLARRQAYDEAVKRFAEALRLRPDYQEARHNLEVAQRRSQEARTGHLPSPR